MGIWQDLAKFAEGCGRPRALPARPAGWLGSSPALGWRLPAPRRNLPARLPARAMGMALQLRHGRGSAPGGALPRLSAAAEPWRTAQGGRAAWSPSGAAAGRGEGGPAADPSVEKEGRAARLSCRAEEGVKGGRAFFFF